MIKIHDGQNNIISSVVIGSLEPEDLQTLLKAFKEKSKEYKSLRWYLEMEDLYNINSRILEQSPIVSDFNFQKIALVGDKTNHKIAALFQENNVTQVRFFQLKDQASAHRWIVE